MRLRAIVHHQRRRASCRQPLFAFSSFVKFQAAIHAIDAFVVPAMTERSQPREQLAKALFRSGMGQLQQQLDDLAIPTRCGW